MSLYNTIEILKVVQSEISCRDLECESNRNLVEQAHDLIVQAAGLLLEVEELGCQVASI